MIFLFSIQEFQISPPPQSYVVKSAQLTPVQELVWECTSAGKDCLPLLQQQKTFYEKIFYPNGKPTSKTGVSKLQILLQKVETPKSPMKSNETYSIKITDSAVQIEAFDTFACSRALASLSQLIQPDPQRKYEKGAYFAQQVEVVDFPHYKLRQLMIDPSRHFLTVQTVKRTLDALAVTKLNTLHFHIIDTQSSAFQPSTEPATDFGRGAFYTGDYYKHFMADLTEIARYANSLGIFIMPEFDMPGHATVWKIANSDIVAHCQQDNVAFGVTLNPTIELTYQYIEAYMKDLIEAFFTPFGTEPLMHLGGDEVQHSCWQRDEQIAKYMKDKGIDTHQLWQEFHKRIQQIFQKLSKNTGTSFFWQEAFANGNDFTNAVVNAYSNSNYLKQATDKNIAVVRTDQWYLDIQFPGGPRKYAFQETWENFYQVQADYNVAQDKKHLVLGGGGCMWGEKVTEANIDEQIWPRSAAIAEALWTNAQDRQITQQVRSRFQNIVCKLQQAGVRTGAIGPSAPCVGSVKE